MVNSNKPIKEGAVVNKATTSKKSILTDKSATTITLLLGLPTIRKVGKGIKMIKMIKKKYFW